MGQREGAPISRRLHLHPWWEDAPGDPLPSRDALVARDLAARIVRDPGERSLVRSLFLRLDPGAVRPLDDIELRAQIESALTSGRLLVSTVREPTLFIVDVQEDAPVAFAERTAKEEVEEEEEECIPCREAKAAQQAAVLRAAASNGTPFCAVT